MNYQQLVNQTHPFDHTFLETMDFIFCKNLRGELIQIEEKTYHAYLKLKEALSKENIRIGLIDAYRTEEEQQAIWDRYQKEFGLDYTKKYVALPGTSEHHTGLAIDIGIVEDGKIYEELDGIFLQKEKLDVIFASLSDYGFLLRYPKEKEQITGYSYEPWHFRYVGVELAKALKERNLTLEEYYQ